MLVAEVGDGETYNRDDFSLDGLVERNKAKVED